MIQLLHQIIIHIMISQKDHTRVIVTIILSSKRQVMKIMLGDTHYLEH